MNEPELTQFNQSFLTHYRSNNEFKTIEVKAYGDGVIVRPCLLPKEIGSNLADRVFIDINEASLLESIKEYGAAYIAKNWPAGEYSKFWGR